MATVQFLAMTTLQYLVMAMVQYNGYSSVSSDDCNVQKEGAKLESEAHCMVCI